MSAAPSHYAVLGVPYDFTPEQLKRAYRLLALRWHPDRNRGDEEQAAEKFKDVQEAFTVLSDPDQRAEYDYELRKRRVTQLAGFRRAREQRAPTPRRDAPTRHSATGQSQGAGGSPAAQEDPTTRAAEPPGKDAAPRPPPPPPPESAPPKAAAARPQPRAAGATTAAGAGAPSKGGSSAEAEEPGWWPDLQAALNASIREAKEVAQFEAQRAVQEVREAEQREAAEIAEAVRMVEEAMQREKHEFEEALRAVEAAELSRPAGGAPSQLSRSASLAIGPQTTDSASQASGAPAEWQLAALMELGFHAQQAQPLCDGVSPIETLVELLIARGGAVGPEHEEPLTPRGSSTSTAGTPVAVGTPAASRNWFHFSRRRFGRH